MHSMSYWFPVIFSLSPPLARSLTWKLLLHLQTTLRPALLTVKYGCCCLNVSFVITHGAASWAITPPEGPPDLRSGAGGGDIGTTRAGRMHADMQACKVIIRTVFGWIWDLWCTCIYAKANILAVSANHMAARHVSLFTRGATMLKGEGLNGSEGAGRPCGVKGSQPILHYRPSRDNISTDRHENCSV